MASVEESIRERLGTDGPLAGLVGDRIYPDTIPDYDTPRPWVVFSVTETAPTEELSADAVEVSVIEFDCIADTKAEVKAVAAAVRSRLHKYRGGQVGRALWLGDQAEDLDGAYLITVRFRVRSSTATILAADGDSNARIVTGSGRIDLYPNGSGLSIWVTSDGVLHGDGSGLTGLPESGDPAGTAADLVAAHEAASDPHPQYTTGAELSAALSGYSTTSHTHAASTLTGTTLAASVVSSSLTSVGASLGIGTATPSGTLHIKTTADTKLHIESGSSNRPIISWSSVGSALGLSFRSNNTEVARFQDNGFCYFNAFGTLNGFNFGEYYISRGSGGNVRVDFESGTALFDFQSFTGTASPITGLFRATTVTSVGLAVRAKASQTADLFQMQDSGGAVLSAFAASGAWLPASMTDAAAPNNSVYYSTTAGKLVFKNSAGTVNNLY